MARALPAAWAVLMAALLAGALVLGFAASRGGVDPGLHAIVALVAAGLAVASHVRRGGGWDFLAVLLLLAVVGLGVFTEAGGMVATLHLTAAIAAVLLSAWLHLCGGLAARLPLAGETR
jgi:hypothetical protein